MALSAGSTGSFDDSERAAPSRRCTGTPDAVLRSALLAALAQVHVHGPLHLTVTIEADLVFSVLDDGPGAPPTDHDGEADRWTLTRLLSTDSEEDGARGLGQVVAACSRVLADSWYGGRHFRVELDESGVVDQPTDLGHSRQQGSQLVFWIDPRKVGAAARLSGLREWLSPELFSELTRHQATLTMHDLRTRRHG